MKASEPAYPRPHSEISMNRKEPAQAGLTKRELFAAMAMQGLMANPQHNHSAGEIASIAIVVADALLTELESNQ